MFRMRFDTIVKHIHRYSSKNITFVYHRIKRRKSNLIHFQKIMALYHNILNIRK